MKTFNVSHNIITGHSSEKSLGSYGHLIVGPLKFKGRIPNTKVKLTNVFIFLSKFRRMSSVRSEI